MSYTMYTKHRMNRHILMINFSIDIFEQKNTSVIKCWNGQDVALFNCTCYLRQETTPIFGFGVDEGRFTLSIATNFR